MNPENPEPNNEIFETPEVQQPEQPELMPEREEALETELLYETTQEYSRLMGYEREDLQRDAIRALNESEIESGLSRDEIKDVRKETGVLDNLAEVQAEAEIVEIHTKEELEDRIIEKEKTGVLKPELPETLKVEKFLGEEVESDEETARTKTRFDPELELKKVITARGSEKKQLLSEWKERFAEHRVNLAEVQEEIIKMIRENPDVFLDENTRQDTLRSIDARYNLNNWELAEVSRKIAAYNMKHTSVRKFRDNYPDDQELYFVAFGRPPLGRVEVIEGPNTLYFRCHDERDYALIHSQKFAKNEEIKKSDIDIANMSGGVSIGSSLAPELKGSIIAENARGLRLDAHSTQIHAHEEQHVANSMFSSLSLPFRNETVRFLEGEASIESEKTLRDYCRDLRDMRLENAEDEIIAYFKEGRRPQDIFSILIKTSEEGGIYDYYAEYFQRAGVAEEEEEKKEKEKDGPAYLRPNSFLKEKLGVEELPEYIEEIKQDVFRSEYRRIVWSGIDAYVDLRNRGYSDEKIAAIFLMESLLKWQKTADRLLSVKPETAEETKEDKIEREYEDEGETVEPITKKDMKRLRFFKAMESAGVQLRETEVQEFERIQDRARLETENLIGLDIEPRVILWHNDEELDREISFLEKWNTLPDEEHAKRIVRADQLRTMENLSEEELDKRRQEIIKMRQLHSRGREDYINKIRESRPLTSKEEKRYEMLLQTDTSTLTKEERLDSSRMRYLLQDEKERLLGLETGPFLGRDLVSYRVNTEYYLAFLKDWKNKSPEEREAALERLEKVEELLESSK